MARKQTDTDLIREIGVTLWGAGWQSAMSRATGISQPLISTMSRKLDPSPLSRDNRRTIVVAALKRADELEGLSRKGKRLSIALIEMDTRKD